MKKWKLIITMALAGTLIFTACGSNDSSSTAGESPSDTANTDESSEADNETKDIDLDTNDAAKPGDDNRTASGNPIIEIEIADYGTLTAELYPDLAPITVANFLSLAEDGFYDGLTFHRIIKGFMIQGGDPDGNGTGGSENTIEGEFSKNGIENNLEHTRGTLSMARSSDPNSARSQFFIMHEDSPHLNGEYAAFGRVIEGIEIVDDICADTPVQDNNGTVSAGDQPVITSIRVID